MEPVGRGSHGWRKVSLLIGAAAQRALATLSEAK